MITEKSVLISIEGSWNKARNLGNFVPGELGILESQIEAKNVKIVHDSGGTWVFFLYFVFEEELVRKVTFQQGS